LLSCSLYEIQIGFQLQYIFDIVPRLADDDHIMLQKVMQYSKQSMEIALENKDSISRIEAAIEKINKTISNVDEDSGDDVGQTKVYTKPKKTKKWFLVSC